MNQQRQRSVVHLPGLTRIRQKSLLSQSELAERAEIGRNTVSRIEAGGVAYFSTARKIAGALRVAPGELMEAPEISVPGTP